MNSKKSRKRKMEKRKLPPPAVKEDPVLSASTSPHWIDIDEVMKVLEMSRGAHPRKWMWPANSRCKYLELTLDMRDGYCIIRDREGLEITLEELQRQRGNPNPNLTDTEVT